MRPELRVAYRLAKVAKTRRYVIGGALWAVVSLLPILSGLLLQRLFDVISSDAPGQLRLILSFSALFVGVATVRGITLVVAWVYGNYWSAAAQSVLRANSLKAILGGEGTSSGRSPAAPGEVISRLRDDVDDLVDLSDDAVQIISSGLFSVVALVVLSRVNGGATIVLFVPLLTVGLLRVFMDQVQRKRHAEDRVRGARVTAFVGNLFSGVLAIKASGAGPEALERLQRLNSARIRTATRDQFSGTLVTTSTDAAVQVSFGLVLLLAAPDVRSGAFTIGDIALFTTYLSWLSALPTTIGVVLTHLPQGAVAVERLRRISAKDREAEVLAEDPEIWLKQDPPDFVQAAAEGVEELELLEADALCVPGEAGHHVLDDVSIRLEGGTLNVVTGSVGAGKSLLLRALLGLVPTDSGTITWNGDPVEDLGTFMVPNRVSYVSQVPRLIEGRLEENILLGWEANRAELEDALWLSALEEDVKTFPGGLDTVVGGRGSRLSGGQVQRATAARALVRSPKLLVIDDLSSALDVQTEKVIWDRLIGRAKREGQTLLVVSNRRGVLERADQVIVLERGRVECSGRLDHLLKRCRAMQNLWVASDDVSSRADTAGPSVPVPSEGE